MVKVRVKKYTLTLTGGTGGTAASDGNAPDTDTVIPNEFAEYIHVAVDTNGVDTGAPTFDVHIETDIEGTNYSDSHFATIWSALAKDKRDSAMLTPPRRPFKVRIDINDAALAEDEFLKVYVYLY